LGIQFAATITGVMESDPYISASVATLWLPP